MLLVLILKDETLVKKVVAAFLELELVETTILDGEGVENLAARAIPLFEEAGSLFGQNLVYNRTLLAHVPERRQVDDLVALCRREGVNLEDPAVATLLLVPCQRYGEGADRRR